MDRIQHEPLWVCEQGKPGPQDIPPCPHCATPRTCEFQVMPQILNYLNLDHSDPDALDFGTLLVYTCPRNCKPQEMNHVPEIVWRQDFSCQGMGDRSRAQLAQDIIKSEGKGSKEGVV